MSRRPSGEAPLEDGEPPVAEEPEKDDSSLEFGLGAGYPYRSATSSIPRASREGGRLRPAPPCDRGSMLLCRVRTLLVESCLREPQRVSAARGAGAGLGRAAAGG